MDEGRREILDALSDKTRLAILEAASSKPLTGDEISEAVQRSRSTVESHLSTLLRLGLIARTKDDKRYYYQATEKARLWMGQSMPQPSPPPPAYKGRVTPTAVVLIVGSLAGAYYALTNSLLFQFSILIFAAAMGVICAFIFSVLKRLLQTFLVTSIAVAIISAFIGSTRFAPLETILLFAFCLAFLVAAGVPLWYLTRRVRIFLAGRRSQKPDRPVLSREQPPGSPPSR